MVGIWKDLVINLMRDKVDKLAEFFDFIFRKTSLTISTFSGRICLSRRHVLYSPDCWPYTLHGSLGGGDVLHFLYSLLLGGCAPHPLCDGGLWIPKKRVTEVRFLPLVSATA